MFGSLGMTELIIVAVIALLIFGPKRLPQFGKAAGDTIKEFRNVGKELSSIHDEDDVA